MLTQLYCLTKGILKPSLVLAFSKHLSRVYCLIRGVTQLLFGSAHTLTQLLFGSAQHTYLPGCCLVQHDTLQTDSGQRLKTSRTSQLLEFLEFEIDSGQRLKTSHTSLFIEFFCTRTSRHIVHS